MLVSEDTGRTTHNFRTFPAQWRWRVAIPVVHGGGTGTPCTPKGNFTHSRVFGPWQEPRAHTDNWELRNFNLSDGALAFMISFPLPDSDSHNPISHIVRADLVQVRPFLSNLNKPNKRTKVPFLGREYRLRSDFTVPKTTEPTDVSARRPWKCSPDHHVARPSVDQPPAQPKKNPRHWEPVKPEPR